MKTKPKNELNVKTPPGSISGIILMVLGYLGIGVTSVIFLPVLMFTLFSNGIYVPLGITVSLLLPLLAFSLFMVFKGTSLRNRVKRFRLYVKQFKGRGFCSIKDLGEIIRKSKKYVVRDLRKMIHSGMFPQGHITEEETFLLLDNQAKEDYEKLQEGIRLQKEEAEKKRIEEERRRALEAQNPALRDVNAVIAEEEKTLEQIREANEAILGEVVSKKLDRLELIISKIFDYMRENPERILEFRKFMGYYLPTTLKLVNTYKNLDRELIQGDNIKTTKKEIEASLDTVNQALEKLLNSFFEGIAMDVSTDISVLQTVLAQEGLIERDFN